MSLVNESALTFVGTQRQWVYVLEISGVIRQMMSQERLFLVAYDLGIERKPLQEVEAHLTNIRNVSLKRHGRFPVRFDIINFIS